MDTNCTIVANPDIAGIGVRIALYMQALLAIMSPLVAVICGTPVLDENGTTFRGLKLDDESLASLRGTSLTATLTGFALLASAWIQSSLYGLDVYHALIVYTLALLNNVTAVINFDVIASGGPSGGNEHEFSVYTAHSIMTGVFGIWLFKDIRGFGVDSQCNSDIVYAIMGSDISATSNVLRGFSIFASVVAILPLVNLLALVYLMLLVSGVVWFVLIMGFECFGYKPRSTEGNLVTLLCYLGLIISLIVTVEGTIFQNRGLVTQGEGAWTFGQTLALLVIVIPLRATIGPIQKAIKKRWNREASQYDPLFGEADSTPALRSVPGDAPAVPSNARTRRPDTVARYAYLGLLENLG